MAAPQLEVFTGIYILATAFLGVYLFQKAPALANGYHDWCCRRGKDPEEAKGQSPVSRSRK